MKIVDAKNVNFEYTIYNENGEVKKITKAIDDLSLEIKKGDFIAILGHNGSGKSTFAKHINALLEPTKGTIFVDGNDTKDIEKLWDIRQTAGMVFQNPDNQIIGSIVEEDVGFGPENLGVETNEIWKRVEDSLVKVDMLDYRKHSPNKLSGGQKQRVAIAGVLAMKPSCIVLDESTAMLDPSGRKEIIDTVIELNKKENITIILITHYMEEAVYADKIYVMNSGKVVIEGKPRDVFAKVDELKKYRLDIPQVTKLAYELKKEGLPISKVVLTEDELVDELGTILTQKTSRV